MTPEPSIADTPRTVTHRPNSVYRYYDHAGRLIYVGITARGIQRQHEHNASSDFWPYVDRQEVEHCRHREEALEIERGLIRAYRPPFNKVHNEDHERLRAAYLAIIRAEQDYATVRAGGEPAPQPCGHCHECAWGTGPCNILATDPDATDPDAETAVTYCLVCGRADCIYRLGWNDGSRAGFEGGYDAGWDGACKTLEPLLRADRSLTSVIDGQVRTLLPPSFIFNPPGVPLPPVVAPEGPE